MSTNNESPAALLPMADDPPLVKLAAMLQALEFGPMAVNLSADALAAACRAIASQAKRASTAPVASESRGNVPDGFVLVPREASDDMLSAGHDAIDSGHKTGSWGECPGVNYGDARRCFDAMLAAALQSFIRSKESRRG